MRRTIFLLCLLTAPACARVSLHDRYIQALEHKFDGDAQTFADTMLSIADEAPASREGRRARATLQSFGWLADLMLLQALGGVVSTPAPPSHPKIDSP